MIVRREIMGFLSLAAMAVLGVSAAPAAAADQVCNVALQVCPKTLEGTTIQVPEDAIWLDPRLPLCNEQVQVQTGSNTPPPTKVFIIDNSGSMNTTDPNEQRFGVTKSLLDSIYKAEPATKVGIVSFSRRLQFDHRENTLFKQADLGDPNQHDSYIPLTALNKTFPDGKLGVDTLKQLIGYTGSGDLNHGSKLPAVRQSSNPNWENDKLNIRDGTDITLGFLAAKQALVGDNNDKANQFFIFLSDGEPSGIDVIRDGAKMDWVQGAGTPTTFTVFFSSSSTPPADIQTMNTNIRNNGYSASNPKSNTWAINLQSSQLLPLLANSVLNPIFANKAATPANASLTYGTPPVNLTTTTIGGGAFVFPSRVPLSKDQTSVNLTYNYTYVDSGKTKTHTATYNVKIQRVPAATPNPTQAKIECHDQGDINLVYNGQKISVVTADHGELDVRLILPNGEVCTNCSVTVQPNANRANKDNENVAVTGTGGTTYGGKFKRETSTTAAANDGKLQHLPTDSIVVTWVNPLNPLDVLRKAFPYKDINTILDVKTHNVYSVTDDATPLADRKQWVLVGSTTVKVKVEDGTPQDCCKLVQGITKEDSAKYVGIKVTASRSFKVEIRVYDNLGQYVNKIAFTVPQAEFENLPKEPTGNIRSLRVLWDNRTEEGSFAGSGAYVFKTSVTLLKIPGIADDQVTRTDHRLVGVVRGK